MVVEQFVGFRRQRLVKEVLVKLSHVRVLMREPELGFLVVGVNAFGPFPSNCVGDLIRLSSAGYASAFTCHDFYKIIRHRLSVFFSGPELVHDCADISGAVSYGNAYLLAIRVDFSGLYSF